MLGFQLVGTLGGGVRRIMTKILFGGARLDKVTGSLFLFEPRSSAVLGTHIMGQNMGWNSSLRP